MGGDKHSCLSWLAVRTSFSLSIVRSRGIAGPIASFEDLVQNAFGASADLPRTLSSTSVLPDVVVCDVLHDLRQLFLRTWHAVVDHSGDELASLVR